MNYIERLLAKKTGIPMGATGRNDRNDQAGTRKNTDTCSGLPAETAKTFSAVSAVSQHQESVNFTSCTLVPSSWRDCLAVWPVEWREKWGRLANALEDEGQVFPRSEFEAFNRVKKEMEHA